MKDYDMVKYFDWEERKRRVYELNDIIKEFCDDSELTFAEVINWEGFYKSCGDCAGALRRSVKRLDAHIKVFTRRGKMIYLIKGRYVK